LAQRRSGKPPSALFFALKRVVFDARELAKLNVPVTGHDKLPDIILYWPERNWLFLIEAVASHGPVSPKRHREIEAMLKNCPAERVYVTAFLDVKTQDCKIVYSPSNWAYGGVVEPAGTFLSGVGEANRSQQLGG
jgi:hypothetical protein